MSDKQINRLVALGVFLVTLFVYMRTLSVTVVFWDVGEFCAASWLLQVPHPPGSPLFLLIARIASLIPYLPDIAARMHGVSAIGSAIGILFLYLVIEKLVARVHSTETAVDKLIVFGSAAIGALSLAFSTTYWDNSIEAEVYGMAMFFTSIALWLALRWWEQADEPHNEKYFLLIAYLLGLSIGVHILALLVAIPVMMIYYFKHYEFTRNSFLKFGVIAVGVFFIIYPGVVQFIPSMLDGDVNIPGFGKFPETGKSDILPFLPLAVVLVAIWYAFDSYRKKQRMLHVACLSFIFIVIGYSVYAQVLIRSNVDNLAMKENNPNNLARLTSYLTREQYGEAPKVKGESWDNDKQDYVEKLFPRRYSREQMHEPTRTNYTSDGDFFWRYQVEHMFIRYILWNYVGEEGDWQDAGVSARETWAIPFILGLIGFYFHYKKEWKMWFVLLAMLIIMGIVLDLYQNQQDPQPRERDYFYVGAYYCIAVWIGFGVVAITDLLRRVVKSPQTFRAATSGVMALLLFAVPLNLARINWHEHDRSKNFIAWDLSYNLLQTCEKDAILFTNGDNDTFPLWYLQDVEGIRRDVRIVNLSLVNTPWYVHLLKHDAPYGSKKVAISFNDDQIEALQPRLWKTQQMSLPVSKEVMDRFGTKDSAISKDGKLTFTMNGVNMNADTKIVRVQDIMVLDIIMQNKWERPMYFAATCSPDSKIGLDNFLWMRGLAYRLKPQRVPAADGNIGGIEEQEMVRNFMGENITPVKTPQDGYVYRNLTDPSVYYDENTQRMVMNYRAGFVRLAFHEMRSRNDNEKAKKIMARMDDVLPIDVIPNQDWTFTANIMSVYSQLGDKERAEKYAQRVEVIAKDIIATHRLDASDQFAPFRILMEIYDQRKDYASAVSILHSAETNIPGAAGAPEITSRIKMYEDLMKGPADSSAKKSSK